MPAHPILTSLNKIMGINMQIQKSKISQKSKDIAMIITNSALNNTVEQLSATTINKLVMDEYRKSNNNQRP